MSGVWRPSGYPTAGAYAGSWYCRFRLCHVRDDGLEVCTLGHYTGKGGRLEPIMPGFNYVSYVMWPGSEGTDAQEVERAACNDAATATAQHLTLLDKYAVEARG